MGRSLTVLNVAYPLAPVGPDAVGGAEQVLAALDAALTRDGHRSLVLACEGSAVSGRLLPVPRPTGVLSAGQCRRARRLHRAALVQALQEWRVDVVHLHGVDCFSYLPPPGVPTLATLHLPLDHYPIHRLRASRPGLVLNCVSESQRRTMDGPADHLRVVSNGVPTGRLNLRLPRRPYALALGRVCPEKGYHHALDAASRARVPLLIGGEVFRYPAHLDYFEREIRPRLTGAHRFLGPIDFHRKRRLLAAARCLVVPSLVAETSSLVAMEALACGTPVVAFPTGALAEVVEPGRTGFLVRDEQEMADAIEAAGDLDPEDCRAAARDRFDVETMCGRYLDLYRELAEGGAASGQLTTEAARAG